MGDLLTLVAILRGVWSKVGARTLIEAHEIERASRIAQELGVMLSQRDAKGETIDTLLPRRQRCAALLLRANHQLRRVVRYLRDDESVDEIVPSIFVVRSSKRTKPSTPVSPVSPVA